MHWLVVSMRLLYVRVERRHESNVYHKAFDVLAAFVVKLDYVDYVHIRLGSEDTGRQHAFYLATLC